MTALIYALIIIMVVDAFLLAYFIVRYVQKKRLKKENIIEKKGKNSKKVEKSSKNENANEKNVKKEKTPKAKMTKHSSFGKIKINEKALKEILAGYDKDEKQNEEKSSVSAQPATAPSLEKTTTLNAEKTTAPINPTSPNVTEQEAVFEDFKVEEPVEERVEEKITQPRFRSPFRNLNERRNTPIFRPNNKKVVEEEMEDEDDDDDFDTDDIEKAYQDFLNRKKQEYLKKYEEDMNIDDLDEDGKNTEKFDEIDTFAKHESIVKDAKANADSNKNSEKKYTLNDFKDDYFNKHLDISEIVDKLSEEDKNKILSILLSKNTIEESDFE